MSLGNLVRVWGLGAPGPPDASSTDRSDELARAMIAFGLLTATAHRSACLT